MTVQHKYRGIMTATPTPFTANGQIDTAAIAAHVDRMIAADADALVPLGGTGEYTSLTSAQRMTVLETSVKAADGRIPVIPGVLSPGIGNATEAGRAFMKAGANALMVVTPYYFRPTQQGIVDYFKKFSDEVDADIILYEIPYRTGVSLNYQTVAQLAAETRVVGMKACNPDLAQQMRVAELTRNKIAILTGEEDVLPLHVAMGAVGAIISSSNLVPRQWARILKLAMDGQLTEAMALHTALRPLIDCVFAEPNPAPIKAAMELLGWGGSDVLAPMLPASAALRERLTKIVTEHRGRE
ncbi:4-hydroxy-tetrahydrodipicolinate synthase [Pigmentiphaga aceris]|uniref:4-hydroxy-tetrahydrodipicolinate synthase n=1 Tax=Pigmentiphaga aceris TaxID=1940612 RepID=A0A5C0AVQ0_9BURK|nr:4-hydroxy-tetrahydrodipicolinate synthase [Pigmentiphaga aceris]QEI04741.1 4-hydroxy-tetrahydrodipicolinate synthase [Pigmentiphaga aceris]